MFALNEDRREFIRKCRIFGVTAFSLGFVWGGLRSANKENLRFFAETHHIVPTIKRRTQALHFVRLRHARIASAFLTGGVKLGATLTALVLFYAGLRRAVVGFAPNHEGTRIPRICAEEALCGVITGSAALSLPSAGYRLYYARKGALIGLYGAVTLALLRVVGESMSKRNLL